MRNRQLSCKAFIFPILLTLGFLSVPAMAAEPLDLRQAVVVCPSDLTKAENTAVRMLVEEVEKRTMVRWPVVHEWPDDSVPVVAVGPASSLKAFAGPLAKAAADRPVKEGAEGYRIFVLNESRKAPTVFVVGNDERGVLFGCGRLLQEMQMTGVIVHAIIAFNAAEAGGTTFEGPMPSFSLNPSLDINTVPECPLRGHQLGYRPKTNSYDAWTPEIWEQYIRDLAVFGTNAIELIPPRSDDDVLSPHFPLTKIDMMARMSQIADDYGLDVWIWYPALDEDYSNPATVEFALGEWGNVFERLPRIDCVFVPGGDPGHTRPGILMALLEKQTEVLHLTHPKAQMWMSPQSFNKEWTDEFLEYMNKEQPDWLSGIVFGPQNRISLPDLRARIPKKYPIRRYPDITHSVRCQYVVQDWDVAYSLTEDREVINPRPVAESKIFRIWKDQAIGFLTYSEGCNDDVNKFVWSGLGWDSSTPVIDILRRYSRYFIGVKYEDDFAQGLLALERNWEGPLLTNESVYSTLRQFQAMEQAAHPQDLLNWRFQQALFRAYFDGYERRRLIYETELEQQAMEALRGLVGPLGSLAAMDRAEEILDRAVTDRVALDWRGRIFELAEALYQSIRMQLSVSKYKAIHVERGAHLDLIDRALNNREWLKKRFSELRALNAEPERLKGIDEIVNWTDPGPGGFYDDLGNLTCQPHLLRGLGPETDPEYRASSRVGFRPNPDYRISWQCFAESVYEAPLQMKYSDLDPNAQYKIRVVYVGDIRRNNQDLKIRMVADEIEVHPYIPKEYSARPVEFDIPVDATRDGKLLLSWYLEPGSGGSGRGCQVAEVWLMKVPPASGSPESAR